LIFYKPKFSGLAYKLADKKMNLNDFLDEGFSELERQLREEDDNYDDYVQVDSILDLSKLDKNIPRDVAINMVYARYRIESSIKGGYWKTDSFGDQHYWRPDTCGCHYMRYSFEVNEDHIIITVDRKISRFFDS